MRGPRHPLVAVVVLALLLPLQAPHTARSDDSPAAPPPPDEMVPREEAIHTLEDIIDRLNRKLGRDDAYHYRRLDAALQHQGVDRLEDRVLLMQQGFNTLGGWHGPRGSLYGTNLTPLYLSRDDLRRGGRVSRQSLARLEEQVKTLEARETDYLRQVNQYEDIAARMGAIVLRKRALGEQIDRAYRRISDQWLRESKSDPALYQARDALVEQQRELEKERLAVAKERNALRPAVEDPPIVTRLEVVPLPAGTTPPRPTMTPEEAERRRAEILRLADSQRRRRQRLQDHLLHLRLKQPSGTEDIGDHPKVAEALRAAAEPGEDLEDYALHDMLKELHIRSGAALTDFYAMNAAPLRVMEMAENLRSYDQPPPLTDEDMAALDRRMNDLKAHEPKIQALIDREADIVARMAVDLLKIRRLQRKAQEIRVRLLNAEPDNRKRDAMQDAELGALLDPALADLRADYDRLDAERRPILAEYERRQFIEELPARETTDTLPEIRILAWTAEGPVASPSMSIGVPMVVEIAYPGAAPAEPVSVELAAGTARLTVEARPDETDPRKLLTGLVLLATPEDGIGPPPPAARVNGSPTPLPPDAPEIAARTAADGPPPAGSLAGEWKTAYADAVLGAVEGTLRVGADEKAALLTLVKPETGVRYELYSSEIRKDGASSTIVFLGRSPASEQVRPPDFREATRLEVATGTAVVSAKVGERTIEAPLKPRGTPDLNRVEVTLAPDAQSPALLRGTWKYLADPLTARDRQGFGRVGEFRILDEKPEFIGEQSGTEAWERTGPEILSVLICDDQEGGAYGYPFAATRNPDDPNSPARERQNAQSRHLLVVGRNLPLDWSAPIHAEAVSPADGTMRYQVLAVKSDTLRANESLGPWFADGWRKATAGLDAETAARVRENLDAVLVRADLQRGVLPGPQRFALNGAAGDWLLAFSDNLARPEIVRDVRVGETEVTDAIFLPETIRIEMRLKTEIPFPELAVAMGQNGFPVEVNGRATLIARPVPGSPKVFRTAPIHILRRGDPAPEIPAGEHSMSVDVRDTVLATSADPERIRTDPMHAVARVYATPDRLGGLWKAALKKAADSKGIEIEDWDHISREKADEFTNYVVSNLFLPGPGGVRQSIAVRIGDHAAMLLLRDTFIDMMHDQMAALPLLRTDAEVDALLRMLEEPAENTPIGKLEVDAPSGRGILAATLDGTWNLETVYNLGYLDGVFGADHEARERWRREAMRQAMRAYGQSMADATRRASETADDDLDELMELCGLGFDPVVERLIPRLMKLERTENPPSSHWVPDRDARNFVRGFGTYAEAVKAQQEFSKIDTQVIIAAAGIAGGLPAMFTKAAWAAVVSATAEVTTGAVSTVIDVDDYLEGQEELRFSRGAGSVLGWDRYRQAEASAPSLLGTAASVVMNVAPAALEVVEAAGRVRIERGRRIAPELESGGLSRYEGLSPEQRRNFHDYVDEARQTRDSGGRLTADQERAIALADRLRDEARASGGIASGPSAADPDRPPDVTSLLPPETPDDGRRGISGGVDDAVPDAPRAPPDAPPPVVPDTPRPPRDAPPPAVPDTPRPPPDAPPPAVPDTPRAPPDAPPPAVPDTPRRPPETPNSPPDTTRPPHDSTSPGPVPDTPKPPPDSPRPPPPDAPQPPPDAAPPTVPDTPRPPPDAAPPSVPDTPRPPPDAPPPTVPDTPRPPPDAAPPSVPDTPRPPPDTPPPAVPDTPRPPPDAPPPTVPDTPRPPPDAAPPTVPDTPRPPPDTPPSPTRAPVTRAEAERVRGDLGDSIRKAQAHLELLAREGDLMDARVAKTRLDDLSQRRQVLDDILKHDPEMARHTPDDLDLVAGRRTQLSPGQVAQARTRLAEHGNSWNAMRSSLKGHPPTGAQPLSKFEMFRAGRHRQEVADGMVRKIIGDVSAERGLKPGALRAQAFGSTNLTSDYDLSIVGEGAEEVAIRYNKLFRDEFKCESGTMFDTNVYTDPVYKFIQGDLTGGGRLAMNPRQEDAARQFVYGQTALRKYLSDDAWAIHRQRMLEAAPAEMRPFTEHVLGAAERSHRGGVVLEDDWLKQNAGWDPKAPGARDAHGNRVGVTPDQELRARNESYGRILEGIDEYRSELGRMQKLLDEGKPVPLDAPFLRDNAVPGYRAAIEKMNEALAKGDAAGVAKFRAEAEGYLAQQLRNRQGYALYFASEAYQTEGAIEHVVGELQAAGRAVTYDGLTSAGPRKLTPERYIESFYENQANLSKELAHLRDASGRLTDPAKAMEKTSKYFIRQLDAAHGSGVVFTGEELQRVLGADGDALLRQTVMLAAARGDDAKWAEALAALKRDYPDFDPADFVRRAEDAASRLSGEMLARSPVRDLAPAFNQTPEGLRAARRVAE